MIWVALGWFLLSIGWSAIAGLHSDGLENYACESLWDLGFHLIPLAPLNAFWLPDAMALGAVVLFFIFTCVVFAEKPEERIRVLRRFFWVMGTVYFMRGWTVWGTRYPRVPYSLITNQPNNRPQYPALEVLAIVAGFHSTTTDLMFSGHTSLMCVIAWFYTWYFPAPAGALGWQWATLGILLILATRHHYTADIVVALFISTSVFLAYHWYHEKRDGPLPLRLDHRMT